MAKFKSIAGAEKRIKQLKNHLRELDEITRRFDAERKVLAKLAATGPAFFNPLEAMSAEGIRDKILATYFNMKPDGTFIN